jgi:hypothetical protein
MGREREGLSISLARSGQRDETVQELVTFDRCKFSFPWDVGTNTLLVASPCCRQSTQQRVTAGSSKIVNFSCSELFVLCSSDVICAAL